LKFQAVWKMNVLKGPPERDARVVRTVKKELDRLQNEAGDSPA
jgi:hypothetical protein